MKFTKRKVIFLVFELFFSLGVPLVLIIFQYSNIGHTTEAVGFRISITGILLLITAFFILKKLVIDKRVNAMRDRINKHIATLETETDIDKISNVESVLKTLRTFEILLGAILPVLFLTAVLIACKALEAQLIRLTGTVGLMLISYMVSIVFSILGAREVVCKNQNKKKEDSK